MNFAEENKDETLFVKITNAKTRVKQQSQKLKCLCHSKTHLILHGKTGYSSIMNIFVVRHGETDWNKEFRLQGHTEIPLNEQGKEQAQKTAAGLVENGIFFDAVYSSPLSRAVETAQILSGFPREKIRTDSRIIELSFGKAEGTTPAERRKNPALSSMTDFFDAPEKYIAKDGAESLESAIKRTADFWENEIKPLENHLENVLVSTHGGTLQSLLLHVDSRSLSHYWDVKIPNCSVNLVVLERGVFRVEYTARTFYSGAVITDNTFFAK